MPVSRPAASLEPEHRDEHWVATHVRRAYSEIAREPLPDTFRSLLHKLTHRNGDQGGETS
ncbi:hypothetical protein GGD88_001354 [Roseospira goensis]|uniref:Anti-sigma factor NepR domain-containing protein n=1 Tax=Roseospira goensis TaxID=391922 RepID=A0A7W6RYL6_9PROT|nr:hypothetical protein [Roseospira goensis]